LTLKSWERGPSLLPSSRNISSPFQPAQSQLQNSCVQAQHHQQPHPLSLSCRSPISSVSPSAPPTPHHLPASPLQKIHRLPTCPIPSLTFHSLPSSTLITKTRHTLPPAFQNSIPDSPYNTQVTQLSVLPLQESREAQATSVLQVHPSEKLPYSYNVKFVSVVCGSYIRDET
jgi:hypothetical protein